MARLGCIIAAEDIPIELRDSSSLNASVCKPHFIEIDFRNMALVWEI